MRQKVQRTGERASHLHHGSSAWQDREARHKTVAGIPAGVVLAKEAGFKKGVV